MNDKWLKIIFEYDSWMTNLVCIKKYIKLTIQLEKIIFNLITVG